MAKPNKKCKRFEKLLSSGILFGFQQRVKASFEYLDAEDHGFFTLKVLDADPTLLTCLGLDRERKEDICRIRTGLRSWPELFSHG
jgi:hypothetical protein